MLHPLQHPEGVKQFYEFMRLGQEKNRWAPTTYKWGEM